jgi:hypothetical protein
VTLAGCATPTRDDLSSGEFSERQAVEYEASFDEVYDAAWLSFEKLGFTVVSHHRREGRFAVAPASLSGEGFEVQATPRETRLRLQVWPRRFENGGAMFEDVAWGVNGRTEREQQVSSLHAQVKALLEAWKVPRELDYLKVGHAVSADGMRVALPPSWNVLELRTDRRRLKLQALKRSNLGANPTLLLELDRRRPLPSTTALAQEAGELAVPDSKFVVPENDVRLPVLLGGGLPAWTQAFEVQAEPYDLDLLTFTTESHAWAVRVAAVCPRPATPDNAPDAACTAAVKGAFAAARRSPSE